MAYKGYKIFDFHTHFPSLKEKSLTEKIDEDYGGTFGKPKLQYLMDNAEKACQARWKAWGMEPPSSDYSSDEEIMDLWEKERATKGIDRIVFVTGGGNENLAGLVKGRDGFIGFAHNDPEEPDAPDKLRVAVEKYGLKGYKILAPTVRRPINDPSLYPLWEEAERLGIPVLIHFGILGGGAGVAGKVNCNPLMLEDIARGFPKTNFVIPHFGAGYMRELLLLGWAAPNVCVDMSGSNQWIRWMPEELTKKDVLRRFIESFGFERIVYGTDSSFLPRGYVVDYLNEWLRIFDELKLTKAETGAILFDNAARLICGRENEEETE